MKKSIIAAALAAMLCMTACGKTENSKKKDKAEIKTEASTVAETTTEEQTTETQTTAEEKTTEAGTATAEKTTGASKEKEDKDEKKSDAKPAGKLSSKYADLDNRSFSYEGKIFTAGINTFADLIEAGIPFKEDDLLNADNNVNKNNSTSWYSVKISDYSTLQFQFGNYTESNLKEKECVLSYVRWFTIYTPLSSFDEERNNDIAADIDKAGETVSFAFPLTLKKDELLANSPKPTEETEYNEVKYEVESTKYYSNSGYEFKFDEDSDQLRDVYITWLP